MKTKSLDRILAVTNDVNEGDTGHLKKSELVEAVRYWSCHASELAAEKESLKTRVLLFATELCIRNAPQERQ